MATSRAASANSTAVQLRRIQVVWPMARAAAARRTAAPRCPTVRRAIAAKRPRSARRAASSAANCRCARNFVAGKIQAKRGPIAGRLGRLAERDLDLELAAASHHPAAGVAPADFLPPRAARGCRGESDAKGAAGSGCAWPTLAEFARPSRTFRRAPPARSRRCRCARHRPPKAALSGPVFVPLRRPPRSPASAPNRQTGALIRRPRNRIRRLSRAGRAPG